MPASFHDCVYVGVDPVTGRHVVREQLYPEARGWIEHEFATQDEALAWLQAQNDA